jgi:Putative transposase
MCTQWSPGEDCTGPPTPGFLACTNDHDRLMKAWRKAVIALLRAALRAGHLRTELTADQMGDLLTHLERCWWSIKIQPFEDKWHFLQYAGRYVRRPPIAQRRITWIGERIVRFWYKDKKLRRRAEVQCLLEEFIDRWAQHIPERYQHAVRSFGLFAPRALGQTSAATFAILGQKRKPRPKPRRWADSVKRDFGRDPLLDHTGKRMKWARRIKAKATP